MKQTQERNQRHFFKNPLVQEVRCDCRSTPARHAASPFQQERHPNAQGKLKPLKLLIRLSTD